MYFGIRRLAKLLGSFSGVISDVGARNESHKHAAGFCNFAFNGIKAYLLYDMMQVETPYSSSACPNQPSFERFLDLARNGHAFCAY